MHFYALTHVEFEGPAGLVPLLQSLGHEVTILKSFKGEAQTLQGADGLLVMGGPMSVHDADELPWLAQEKQLVKEAINQGLPVLGICLGAQIMAEVLGGRVTRNPFKEIGWFPIERIGQIDHKFWSRLPSPLITYHWHGETFSLPQGATPLWRSEACALQGFVFGKRALALQFHPEMTSEGMEALLIACPEDLAPGTYVMDAAAHREGMLRHEKNNRAWLHDLVIEWLAGSLQD